MSKLPAPKISSDWPEDTRSSISPQKTWQSASSSTSTPKKVQFNPDAREFTPKTVEKRENVWNNEPEVVEDPVAYSNDYPEYSEEYKEYPEDAEHPDEYSDDYTKEQDVPDDEWGTDEEPQTPFKSLKTLAMTKQKQETPMTLLRQISKQNDVPRVKLFDTEEASADTSFSSFEPIILSHESPPPSPPSSPERLRESRKSPETIAIVPNVYPVSDIAQELPSSSLFQTEEVVRERLPHEFTVKPVSITSITPSLPITVASQTDEIVEYIEGRDQPLVIHVPGYPVSSVLSPPTLSPPVQSNETVQFIPGRDQPLKLYLESYPVSSQEPILPSIPLESQSSTIGDLGERVFPHAYIKPESHPVTLIQPTLPVVPPKQTLEHVDQKWGYKPLQPVLPKFQKPRIMSMEEREEFATRYSRMRQALFYIPKIDIEPEVELLDIEPVRKELEELRVKLDKVKAKKRAKQLEEQRIAQAKAAEILAEEKRLAEEAAALESSKKEIEQLEEINPVSNPILPDEISVEQKNEPVEEIIEPLEVMEEIMHEVKFQDFSYQKASKESLFEVKKPMEIVKSVSSTESQVNDLETTLGPPIELLQLENPLLKPIIPYASSPKRWIPYVITLSLLFFIFLWFEPSDPIDPELRRKTIWNKLEDWLIGEAMDVNGWERPY